MRKKSIVLILLVALAAVAAGAWDYPLAKPQIASNAGKPAPEFELKDQDGKLVKLSSLRGSKVLLVFYRAHWCPYCMSQLRDIAANIQKFEKLNVRVIAISVDTPDKQRKVYEEAASRKFTVLSDPDLTVIRKYGLLDSVSAKDSEIAIRTSVFVDEKGIEVWRRVSERAADVPKAEELLARIEGK